MSAIVTYNGSVIHATDSSDPFTLNTDKKYMEGDIVVSLSDSARFPEAIQICKWPDKLNYSALDTVDITGIAVAPFYYDGSTPTLWTSPDYPMGRIPDIELAAELHISSRPDTGLLPSGVVPDTVGAYIEKPSTPTVYGTKIAIHEGIGVFYSYVDNYPGQGLTHFCLVVASDTSSGASIRQYAMDGDTIIDYEDYYATHSYTYDNKTVYYDELSWVLDASAAAQMEYHCNNIDITLPPDVMFIPDADYENLAWSLIYASAEDADRVDVTWTDPLGRSMSAWYPVNNGEFQSVTTVPGAVLIDETFSSEGTYYPSLDDADGFKKAVVEDIPTGAGLAGVAERSLLELHDNEASYIASLAFYSYSTLTAVEFTNVTSIDTSAFNQCYSLRSISFPACVTLGTRAFAACYKLRDVYLPSCEVAGNMCFYSCSDLQSISLPACVLLSSGTFYGCSRLTDVYLPVCQSIGPSAFMSCNSLSFIELLECVHIKESAFFTCRSLVSISFPKAAYLAGNAFYYCDSLSDVYLPVCESVYNLAFAYCSALSTLSLPMCTDLYSQPFDRCYGLKSLYLLGESVVSLRSSNAFRSTPMIASSYLGEFGSIFVPAQLVDVYKSATNWSLYSDRITAYVE